MKKRRVGDGVDVQGEKTASKNVNIDKRKRMEKIFWMT